MKHTPLPPLEVLKEYLDYNPDTGIITWKKKPHPRIKIGQEIGYCSSSDRKYYRQFMFKGRNFYAHRVAYYNKFRLPKNLPLYYQPTNYVLQTWSSK